MRELQIPGHGHQVGAGWEAVLAQLHAELTALAPDYQVTGLKEKYGALRIELADESARGVTEALAAATVRSHSTCERCGVAAVTAPLPSGRLKTLCDPCRPKAMTEAPEWRL